MTDTAFYVPKEKRDRLAKKAGIDREEDARIITGR